MNTDVFIKEVFKKQLLPFLKANPAIAHLLLDGDRSINGGCKRRT